jgi:integrase
MAELCAGENRSRKPVRSSIPMMPDLERIVAATPGTATSMTFLSSGRGTPYSQDSFGNVFRAWCQQAGLPHCSAHGLRKAAASRLAGWGQLYMKIAAVTGHRYTQGAEQKKLAASALARLTVEQTAHEKSHFGAATPQWGAQPTEKKGLCH